MITIPGWSSVGDIDDDDAIANVDDDDEYDYNDYNDHTSDHESDLPRASSPRSCWRAKPGRRGTG